MFNKRTKWICAGERFGASAGSYNEAAGDGRDALLMLARRMVKLPKRIKSASAMISADDYFSLCINGQFVSQGTPSCYPGAQYVQKIDIAGFLKPGINLFAVLTFYDGKGSRSRLSGDNRQGFILEVKIDGQIALQSNDRFRCLCPIGASFARSGGMTCEEIDLRGFPADWTQLKFDDSTWKKPHVKRGNDYEFVEQPIKNDLYVEFGILPNTDGILDLEDDYTGTLKLKANGLENAALLFYDADKAECEAPLYSLRFSGDAEAEFILPHRLRRLKVSSENGAVLTEVSARVLRLSDETDALSVKTLDPRIIDSLKRWRSVLLDDRAAAFDPPESGIDENVLSLARAYMSGDMGHMIMLLNNMALSQSRSKTLLVGSPASLAREDHESSLMFIWHLLNCFRHTDDIDLLEDLKSAAGGVLRAFSTYARRDGLIENADENGEKQCLSRINAIYIGAQKAYEDICALLNTDGGNRSHSLVKAFDEAFYDEESKLYFVSLSDKTHTAECNIFPQFFGFAPKESKAEALKLLRTVGDRKSEYYRLKALCACGGQDVAYEQLVSGMCGSPEAEICVFIEEILSINRHVVNGEVWKHFLPESVGNLSARVKALARNVVFNRKDGLSTLKY